LILLRDRHRRHGAQGPLAATAAFAHRQPVLPVGFFQFAVEKRKVGTASRPRGPAKRLAAVSVSFGGDPSARAALPKELEINDISCALPRPERMAPHQLDRIEQILTLRRARR